MDHLARTNLLLFELSLPSQQRLMPGGASKARTRRLARTSAAMPYARGEEKIVRRIDDRQRFNQPRDIFQDLYSRKASRNYMERRPKVDGSHLSIKRDNPQADARPAKRGNPQNKAATQIRISPSKQTNRPAVARTLGFVSRAALLTGLRV